MKASYLFAGGERGGQATLTHAGGAVLVVPAHAEEDQPLLTVGSGEAGPAAQRAQVKQVSCTGCGGHTVTPHLCAQTQIPRAMWPRTPRDESAPFTGSALRTFLTR